MTASFSLTTEQLAELFPFHLLVDDELRFASLGKSLIKLQPSLAIGARFVDHFRLGRPRVLIGGLHDLLTLQSTLVRLEPVDGKLQLRGQVVAVSGGAAILASPWLQHPDQAPEVQLSLRDFAHHDPTLDLLFMMQGKTAALNEAKMLAHKLRERSEELKIAMREAHFANRAKSSFLANVSHEFRTPMTAILGYADMIFDQVDDEQVREFIDIIRQQSRHLLEIMNDVLDLSKIESGHFSVQRDLVPLFEIVGELERQFEPAFKRKGIHLRVICQRGVPAEIWTNRVRFKQILVGLLSNALKFTNHGVVTVTFDHVSQEGGDVLRVSVKDTGIGIDPDQESRLFRPFAQPNEGAPHRRTGTGLGLTIAKRLANMLGGDVTYLRPEGQGSVFQVEISTAGTVGAVAACTTTLEPDGQQPASKPDSSSVDGQNSSPRYPQWDCRILLVEDAAINQTLICRLIELTGATTVVAGHGREAVEMLLGGNPIAVDLILMDMQMPILDGCEATKQLRAAGVRLPIIALTANTAESDREVCLKAGCDDFLTKPIDRFQLYRTIQTHLDRRAATEGTAARGSRLPLVAGGLLLSEALDQPPANSQ